MVFFKTETHYEYIEEHEDVVIVDPMFYSAYHYARKALINKDPENEMLDNMETNKKYYSVNLKIRPEMILKNYTTRDIELRGQTLTEVEVSPFFFKLMEVFPRFLNYRFYTNPESIIPEMDVSIRGSIRTNSYPHQYNFPEDIARVKSNSYKRGEEATKDILNINFVYIYLALGAEEFPSTTNFTVNNAQEYLDKLQTTISKITETMSRATPSKGAIHSLLPNAGNEARASFYQLLAPEIKSFEQHIEIASNRSEYKSFVYPTVIEKKSANDEHYSRDPDSMSDLIVEDLTLEQKLLNDVENYQTLNLSVMLDVQMQTMGYNLRMITQKAEQRFFNYGQRARNDYFTRLMFHLTAAVSNERLNVLE